MTRPGLAAVDVSVEPWRLTEPFEYAHDTISSVDIVALRVEPAPGAAEPGEGVIAADTGYGHDSGAIAREARELAGALAPGPDDPATLHAALRDAEGTVSGPARMLVEMALLDRAARRAGVPVWRLLGLPEPGRIRLLHTVPFGAPVPDVRPVKVKLGGPGDESLLRGLVGVPGPVLLDVNQGWDAARWRELRALVVAVAPAVLEDPVDDPALLPEIRAALPGTAVVLDEPVNSRADVARAAALADGANIKPTRVGGLLSTLDSLEQLTGRGAARMIGCFLEPPRTIAYLAQLACRFDWTDLDGHFWLCDDPVAMSYTLDSSRPGIPRIVY
jgi:L-alanine-DL-glutamate epimerase-like enolase superfamily enzyme